MLSADIQPVTNDPTSTSQLEENVVKLWRKRIKDARAFFEDDFKRMRENMEYAAGIQWQSQTKMDDTEERYQANFMTKHVNDKVASLYAKDPKCEARVRDRLVYQIWDGTVEQEQQAQMAVMQAMMTGMVTPIAVQAQALLQDIQQGKQLLAQIKRVGETLQRLYTYQCDTCSPSFKFQMKQLVRRVITTGVGYVRINYVNDFGHVLSSSLTDDSLAFRLKRIRSIMAGMEDDKIRDNDPRIEQLRLLLDSVESSVKDGDTTNVEERLEFDFPSSTSIIVDPKCKCLKGFIGAEWVVQQFIMPLDAANSYFELRGLEAVTVGKEFIQYTDTCEEVKQGGTDPNQPNDVQKSPLGCFWEVFDLTTKEHFFICDGWPKYVQAPAPVEPSINRFWPIFALTFNDVEVEPGCKVRIYPPSDVQLLKQIQKESNRIGNELKEHRESNRPFYWALKGLIAEQDKEKLANHRTGELIELTRPLQGPGGQDMPAENAIGKWEGVPVSKELYDRANLSQDLAMVVGANPIQSQQPIRHVAATPAVIQEQARMSGVSSNVDDLDDLFCEMADAGGEMLLRTFQPATVLRIVGPGAAWPQQNREDFLNQLYLTIIAASSGRPNKAVDMQNAQQVVPLLLQAGANPWAVIAYVVKILDANLNVADFAPVGPIPAPAPASGGAGQSQPLQAPQMGQSTQQPGRVGNQPGGQGFPSGVQLGGAH